jgi:hypothetical protein
MGYRCAHDPAGSERRAKTLGERARGAKRDLLRAADRLPTEGAAKDLPPKSTVHDYLELWDWDGTLERVHHSLYVAWRCAKRRDVKQARRRRSSTRRPRRALKKGILA